MSDPHNNAEPPEWFNLSFTCSLIVALFVIALGIAGCLATPLVAIVLWLSKYGGNP